MPGLLHNYKNITSKGKVKDQYFTITQSQLTKQSSDHVDKFTKHIYMKWSN